MTAEIPVWFPTEDLALHLVIDEPTPSNNIIKGLHFHAYKTERRKWRQRVLTALDGQSPSGPIEQAAIVVVRGSSGNLDWDNAYGGLKPLLDCLVSPSDRNPDGLGVIRDDNPKNMPFPPYVRQETAKPGQGWTEVFVFRL